MNISQCIPFVRIVISSFLISFSLSANPTEIQFLSGTGSDDTVQWEFKVNGGRNSGTWSTIPVPSNWEMQGFGTYHYWKDWGEDAASDSLGQYRYHFKIPGNWTEKRVDLVFGAVMTDAEVLVNGVLVGPSHQGGFYQFSYEISQLLKRGEDNLLEVNVKKFSENESVNLAEREADYWLFGGIYRPVWLEARPASHIDRFAIDATHDGRYSAHVFLDGDCSDMTVSACIIGTDGVIISKTRPIEVSEKQKEVIISGLAKGVSPWSAEWPNLYQIKVTLNSNGQVIHEVKETIGFRTISLRPKDGLYVNGKKVILKGSNRHSFWPETGRTTNATLSEQDVLLMKEMNMNAVRMSHYPPDPHFLEACDRLGLYVLDELGGWQKSYDSEVGAKLVKETVVRDVNHASIILWDNGNEGGWNTDLDDDFALYDPQKRVVLHPWANFNGINTSHYENYDSGSNWFFHGDDLFMPTEFLHGLYDGGHGAGLDDWWKRILAHPLGLGGFLWAFADEGIVRGDQDNHIDVAGNSAPDGIVGPHREKEASFFTIKEIWSPIYFPMAEVDYLPPTFKGFLRLENRYSFTNTDQIRFVWKLKKLSGQKFQDLSMRIIAQGDVVSPSIEPSFIGELEVILPEDWMDNDSFELAAYDPYGREIYTWSWMIQGQQVIAQRLVDKGEGIVQVTESETEVQLSNGLVQIVLDKKTGQLISAKKGGVTSALMNGPILLSGQANPTHTELRNDGVTVYYEGAMRRVDWLLHASGWLQLDYEYHYKSDESSEYFGVTFDFDENQVTGLRWLGKGPYRVWKNRKKGVEFNIWEKAFNDTITGESWIYPEFKGFHDEVYFAELQDLALPLTVVVASPHLNLRVFTPKQSAEPRDTHVNFPAGDLSFLHAITPIGTKFKTADKHGPAGQINRPHRGGQTFNGTLYFWFGSHD